MYTLIGDGHNALWYYENINDKVSAGIITAFSHIVCFSLRSARPFSI